MKYKTWMAPAVAGLMATLCPAAMAVVTFETVPLGGAYGISGVWNGKDASGSLVVDGAAFTNSYTDGGSYYYWSGFAASSRTGVIVGESWLDSHQYLSAPGGGANASTTYGIFFGWGSVEFGSAIDMVGKGSSITNTAYGLDSMMNGDSFAKKFGGTTGNDADWFKLTITGSLAGNAGSSIEFYLADFRFADNSQDYILTDWAFVDFSALGTVDKLDFALSSSDNHELYGMNTPAYFAIDDIGAVPESSSLAFAAVGLLVAMRRGRK